MVLAAEKLEAEQQEAENLRKIQEKQAADEQERLLQIEKDRAAEEEENRLRAEFEKSLQGVKEPQTGSTSSHQTTSLRIEDAAHALVSLKGKLHVTFSEEETIHYIDCDSDSDNDTVIIDEECETSVTKWNTTETRLSEIVRQELEFTKFANLDDCNFQLFPDDDDYLAIPLSQNKRHYHLNAGSVQASSSVVATSSEHTDSVKWIDSDGNELEERLAILHIFTWLLFILVWSSS